MRLKEGMMSEFLGGETFIQTSGEIDMERVNAFLSQPELEALKYEDLSDDLKRFFHKD